jgi:hypothetical protein
MFRNQLLIAVSVLTIVALAVPAQAEVIIQPSADGGSEVQVGNIRVGAGTVSIRRNSRLRKKNRYEYSTKVAPRVYYPVMNPDHDDGVDYGQNTTRSSSTSTSTVNGRTHQTTTVQENGRTVTHSNTRY